MKAYLALTQNELRLAFRDKQVLFFNYAFPLIFFFLFLFVIRAAFWGRRWGGPGRWGPGSGDHGEWRKGRGAMFEDWHRRQHEQASGDHPSAGGEPAAV